MHTQNSLPTTVNHSALKLRQTSTLIFCLLALCGLMVSSLTTTNAQTTSFSYQGKLDDGGSPANGAYDLQFKLFDALSGGAQVGSTINRDDLIVTAGTFTTALDFGAAAFPGANRWLEVSVRPGASTGAYTTLSPRQQITSVPYAIKSLNATTADGLSAACVGCVTNTQISSLPAGNGNYIQNTTSPQTGNFNINGSGTVGNTLTANAVNVTQQYNIAGNRILSNSGSNNLFVGVNAGTVNTGSRNAFFGEGSGLSNIGGSGNSFFGRNAGWLNTSGNGNTFLGEDAGSGNQSGGGNTFVGWKAGSSLSNTAGIDNAFFGSNSGANNTGSSFVSIFDSQTYYNGSYNAFFGPLAGFSNLKGIKNAFFGYEAGYSNIGNSFDSAEFGPAFSGANNAFFGYRAGYANTSGENNTYLGANAGGSATNIGSTAIGADTNVTCSGCTVIGTSSNFSGHRVGIGTSAPTSRLEIVSSGAGTGLLHLRNTNERAVIGLQSTIGGIGQTWTIENGVFGTQGLFAVYNSTSGATALSIRPSNNIGMGTDNPSTKLHVVGTVTATAFVQSSDQRFKQGIQPLSQALSKLSQLRGVSYEWKRSEYPQMNFSADRQIGLLAQEVEKVFPEAVQKDRDGMYSVSYMTLIPVVIEAIKEQQQQVEAANAAKDKQLEQLRQENAALRQRLEAIEKVLEKIVNKQR